MDAQFTISMLTERETSALLRIVATLGRHGLQIESLVTSAAGMAELYRHTVVVRAQPDRVRRAMKQLSSALGVVEANYYSQGDTVDRELGLYKLSVDLAEGGEALERIVLRTRARVILAGPGHVVVEKTGSREELDDLFGSLEPFGVMEFVRSGQTTVTRPMANTMVPEETNGVGASTDAHGG
jgi:acetolactate synthase-1/3 small subunit